MAKEAAQAEVPAAKPVAEPTAETRPTKPGLAAEAIGSQPLWVQLRDGSASPGEALRAMSSSFGQPFGDVELADDPTAHAEARGRRAAAFTQGQRIAFAAGRFAPSTPGGAFTLAHELAHVLQLRAGADPTAGSEIEAVLEVQADRAAFDVLGGRRPELTPAGAASGVGATPAPGQAPILRQDEQAAGPAGAGQLQPVVLTGTYADAMEKLVRVYATQGLVENDIVVLFHVDRTLRAYRGRQFRGLFHLDPEAASLSPGIYLAVPGGPFQLWRDPVTGHVQRRPEPTIPGEIDRYIDQVVAGEEAALSAVAAGSFLIHVRLGSIAPEGTGTAEGGAGHETGRGSEHEEAGEGAVGEAGGPGELPKWAATMNEKLVGRLRREQLRIADLARRTIADTSPEMLRRLYSLEGIPKRLGIGMLDGRPVEQVTVALAGAPAVTTPGSAAPAAAKPTLREAHNAVPLKEKEPVGLTWERIVTVARLLYQDQADSGPAKPAPVPGAEIPIGHVGTGKVDPEAVAPNQPAYPSKIVNYGPDAGVVGAVHHFSMELDWSTEGEWAWTGPMALRGYDWKLFEIDPAKLGLPGRAVGPGEGAQALLSRGFADISEDLASSTVVELAFGRDLVGLDAALRSVGTVAKSWFSLVSTPINERAIQFTKPGTYVVVSSSAQLPVHRTEKIPDPQVRAPSVAVYPIQVANKAQLAAQAVAPSELAAARAELERLKAGTGSTDEAQQADRQRQITELEAEVQKLAQADRADLPSHLTDSIKARDQEIATLKALIELNKGPDPYTTWTNWQARIMRASLKLKDLEPEVALRLAEAERTQLVAQQEALAEVTDLQAVTYRPYVSFVGDTDGRVLPVMMLLGEEQGSTDRDQRWALIDVSVSGHRDRYEGSSRLGGTVGRAAAIRAAFEKFAGSTPYGRGAIAIRLPDTLISELGNEAMPTQMRARPDESGRWWQRLESLATAAALAGLVLTGPAGAAVGVIGGLAGGAVAAHSMYRRYTGGYLEPDLQTAMDVAAIVGAFAGVSGVVAGRVPAGSKFVRTADWVERGVKIYGYVQLGGSFLIIPYDYYQKLKAIDPTLSPGQRAALQLEAFVTTIKSSLELAVSAAQMIDHATDTNERRRRPPDAEPGAVQKQPPVEEKPAVPPVDEKPAVPPVDEKRPPTAVEEKPPAVADQPTPAPAPKTAGRLRIEDLVNRGGVISDPYLQAAYEAYVARSQAKSKTPMAPLDWVLHVTSGDVSTYLGTRLGGDWRAARKGDYPGYHPELIDRPTRAPKGKGWTERRVALDEIRPAVDGAGDPYWTFPELRDGEVLVLPSGTRAWQQYETLPDGSWRLVVFEEHPVSASVSGKRGLTRGEEAMISGKEKGTPEMQRLHGAASPGLGFDSPYSLAHGESAVNQAIEAGGIEKWVRGLRDAAPTGVQYVFTTATAKEGGVLAARTYRVAAVKGGTMTELLTFHVDVPPDAPDKPTVRVDYASLEAMERFANPENVNIGQKLLERLGYPTGAEPRVPIAPELVNPLEASRNLQASLDKLADRITRAAGANADPRTVAMLEELATTREVLADATERLAQVSPSDPRLEALKEAVDGIRGHIGASEKQVDVERLSAFHRRVTEILGT